MKAIHAGYAVDESTAYGVSRGNSLTQSQEHFLAPVGRRTVDFTAGTTAMALTGRCILALWLAVLEAMGSSLVCGDGVATPRCNAIVVAMASFVDCGTG